MIDAHELISKLKDMAIDLGRTPTRDEFDKATRGGKRSIQAQFGTFAAFVQAAGLEQPRPRKVDNTIFNRDITKHLDAYHGSQVRPIIIEPLPTAAIISDIHWPFSSQRVVDRFYEYVGDVKPKHVIINGDAWDMYSHGKFPRSHNVFTPREEQEKARQMNEKFWEEIKRRSPTSSCLQMLGNHDIRPMKRIIEEYPEAEDWVKEKLKQLFTFQGVMTEFDVRKEFFLNANTIVFHGYRTKLGDHRDYTLFNSINGHSHTGGVVFRKIRDMVLFECNSGFAGDPDSKGLTYTPQRITNWTPGFAATDPLGPRFIPV